MVRTNFRNDLVQCPGGGWIVNEQGVSVWTFLTNQYSLRKGVMNGVGWGINDRKRTKALRSSLCD